MLKINAPIQGIGDITLTLVGMVSMRIINDIAERLGITPTAAISLVQDKINNEAPSIKALPSTMGGSTRFLFAPLIGSNEAHVPFLVDMETIQGILKLYPELTPPDVETEKELFDYVVPDFTTIH